MLKSKGACAGEQCELRALPPLTLNIFEPSSDGDDDSATIVASRSLILFDNDAADDKPPTRFAQRVFVFTLPAGSSTFSPLARLTLDANTQSPPDNAQFVIANASAIASFSVRPQSGVVDVQVG